jgi:hypothetical protein
MRQHECDRQLGVALVLEVQQELLREHVDLPVDLVLGLRGRLGKHGLVRAAQHDERHER